MLQCLWTPKTLYLVKEASSKGHSLEDYIYMKKSRIAKTIEIEYELVISKVGRNSAPPTQCNNYILCQIVSTEKKWISTFTKRHKSAYNSL
jgi:hypothetical protein